jgi:hypothetical protein
MKKLKVKFLSGTAYLDGHDIVKKHDDGRLDIEWFGRKTITPDMYEVISKQEYEEHREKKRLFI